MPTLVSKPAPDFKATAVLPDGTFKEVKLEDYKGKNLVIFFYPLDFTFVCPTEIIAFSDKIDEFKKRDITIILVSHTPAMLRQVCDSVIWLQDGRVVEQGDTNEVLNRYVESVFPVHTNLPDDTIEPN